MLPRLPELAREVAEIANGVVASARGAGRDDLADLLVAAASRWSEAGTTVAVVGETGVGKTALVNALVGRQVLPTRDLAPRSVTAVVRPGAEAAVVATARSVQVPLDLEPGAIATWLDAQGPVSDGVTALDVTVTGSAAGPTTTVIDTVPDARGVLTAQACDVLVFVTDADAPLTQPELELLDRARGAAGAVVVVLSRVDRFRGWTEIRAADEALLPGCLVLPVSSSLAAAGQALVGRDDDESASLEEESGVRALRSELARLAARTREVRLLGLLRLALAVGEEVAPPPVVPDPAEADQLQARLDGLRARATEIGVALGDETQRLRESVVVEVKREAGRALAEREARGLKDDADDVGALLEDLDVARLRLERSVAERTEALQEWLMQRLEGSVDRDTPFDALRPQAAPVAAQGKDRSLRLRFAAAMLSTGSGAVLIGSMVVPGLGDAMLRPALMSLGMLSGGVSAIATLRHTGAQREAQVRKAAARGLVDEWQAVTGSSLRAELQTTQRRIEGALRTAITDLGLELTDRIAVLRGSGATPATDTRSVRAHLLRAGELAGLLQEVTA